MMLGDFTIYHCSSLHMDQYSPPVLESGCRYLKSVVKFFFSCFLLVFTIFFFRLLQGLAASSDWTFVFPGFLFASFFLLLKVHVFFVQEVKFKTYVCSFSKYIYSMSQVFKEVNVFFWKEKKEFMWILASNWEYSYQPASSSLSPYFLYFL